MITLDYVAQPSSRSTIDAVTAMLKADGIESIDVAAAYATSSGVRDLLDKMSGTPHTWKKAGKRWLTSFDYCRSEPVALAALSTIPLSQVRIFDAQFCLNNQCMPRVPYHPKAYLIRGNTRELALAGSGNLSRSGLSRGIEAGLVIDAPRADACPPLRALSTWFDSMWVDATPLTASLLRKYEKVFEAADNLTAPTPTEDDVASNDIAAGALTKADLLKLRVCRNFWIEAGNITRNRGPRLPGSQLMMKRLSRVFFGFPPTLVPENSQIGIVNIGVAGGAPHQYSLTYSDNKMDKLNLPIPGAEGPGKYDGECIMFYRKGLGEFNLVLGNAAEKTAWIAKSKAIGGAFVMHGGRRWGVF